MTNNHFLLYVGNLDFSSNASQRFIISVTDEVYQKAKKDNKNISGIVVAAGHKSVYSCGYESPNWVNPFDEMKVFGYPVFIKIRNFDDDSYLSKILGRNFSKHYL